MRVSWGVQAHPDRAVIAKRLAARIGGDTEIVWDPDPSGYRSPWRTFRHLLESTPAWATHRVQAQDDAEVCDGIRAAVDALVEAHPDRLILLYVGGNPYVHAQKVREACRDGRCVVDLPHSEAGHWTPCVATIWPVGMIWQLVEFVDSQNWPETFTADDEIVGRFVRHARVTPLATVPSLVQHPDTEPSTRGSLKTRGGLDPGRVAALYVGDCTDCDPLTFDWESGTH